MEVYIYAGDIYCPDCTVILKQGLDAEVPTPDIDDSASYPQGPYDEGGGEADSFHHCARCGVFIENPLTEEGVEYVVNALREFLSSRHGDCEVLTRWAVALKDYSLEPDQESILARFFREETMQCCLCAKRCAAGTAHIHQGEHIGNECCWDERLRSSE